MYPPLSMLRRCSPGGSVRLGDGAASWRCTCGPRFTLEIALSDRNNAIAGVAIGATLLIIRQFPTMSTLTRTVRARAEPSPATRKSPPRRRSKSCTARSSAKSMRSPAKGSVRAKALEYRRSHPPLDSRQSIARPAATYSAGTCPSGVSGTFWESARAA